MLKTITFNGVTKPYLFLLQGSERPAWAPREHEIIEISGMPGGLLSSTSTKMRVINLPVVVRIPDGMTIEEIKEDMAAWLVTEEPAALIISDEPDRTYYAVVDDALHLERLIGLGQGIITFLCPDPHKYGTEQSAPGDEPGSGRNYIRNSLLKDNFNDWAVWHDPVTSVGFIENEETMYLRAKLESGNLAISTPTFEIEEGEYTLSFDAASYYNTPQLDYMYILYSDGINHKLDDVQIEAGTTVLRRYSLTFNAPRNDSNAKILFGKRITGKSWEGFKLRKVQLEKGTTAKPYSPAPEDTGVIELNNEGSADTYPIVEVKLKKPVTFVSIGNGHDINMIGDPAAVDDYVYEPRTIILNDPMTTDTGWGFAGFQPEGSVKAGSVFSNGQAIMPSDYGTGISWHGPARQKSLSEQLQDFGVEFTFRFSARYAREIGKVQLYGLDERNKKIFMLGMTDYWVGQFGYMPEGGVYNDLEQRRDVLVRNENDDWSNFFGYLRLIRNGRDIEVFLKMVDQRTGKEIATKLRRYFDSGNLYQRKLASLGLHFAAFGSHTPIDTIYASHVTVWRVNRDTGIPYIGQPGDVVRFDHQNDLITLNGEDINSSGIRKAFIGNFFSLKPGKNAIAIEPSDAIETMIARWRDRWR